MAPEMAPEKNVVRNVAEHRFEVEGTNGRAVLTYNEGHRHITLIHTEVPPEFAGQGYGGLLSKAALDYARSANLRVIALCPFVLKYVERHPEYADLISAG